MRTVIGFCGISLLILGLAAGCIRTSGKYSVVNSHTTWSMGKSDEVGGVDVGTVAVVTLKKGSADVHRFVVWGDVRGPGSSLRTDRRGASYKNSLVTPDGRQIGIIAAMKSGQPGSMQIGDARFQLTDDTIFLVSTANNKVTVKQLQGGVEAFTSLPELKVPQVQELLQSRPEIREFFEAQHTGAAAK